MKMEMINNPELFIKREKKVYSNNKITEIYKCCSLVTLHINSLTFANKNTQTNSLDKKTGSVFLLHPRNTLVLDTLEYTCLGCTCLYFFV